MVIHEHNVIQPIGRALNGRLGASVAVGRRAVLDFAPSMGYAVGMAKKLPDKLSDQIRLLLDECGQTRYRIAKSTGIDEGSLAKFYNGHRGLSMDALDRLAVYLGMRVTLETSKGKKVSTRKKKC